MGNEVIKEEDNTKDTPIEEEKIKEDIIDKKKPKKKKKEMKKLFGNIFNQPIYAVDDTPE